MNETANCHHIGALMDEQYPRTVVVLYIGYDKKPFEGVADW
jgi:hypothetical protein